MMMGRNGEVLCCNSHHRSRLRSLILVMTQLKIKSSAWDPDYNIT